jgi:DNA helicase II / ATP-dependent DNA helicase PcrA
MMSNDAVRLPVNDEIYACLDLDNPKSFFLFAGAGSGKTRSLVEVLTKFRENNITRLRKHGQKVAVITYTNAACDEIKRRLDFDSSFRVSTIHSFAWDLVRPYTEDIKAWVKASLEADIAELQDMQSKAKNTSTKIYIDRGRKIESKQKRVNSLKEIRKFTYNPNGDNVGRDSLNHAEVISIAASFIQKRALMQSILVRQYPVLLIDESQDTKKELVDAFFRVQELKSNCFALGMFGDTMQRIYADGKPNLGEDIPGSWAKPEKTINYRCPKRVITLINKIRSAADGQQQEASKEDDGLVRLFIVDAERAVDRMAVETTVLENMEECTGDAGWNASSLSVKVLTLEHHMAASRGGFSVFFNALYAIDKYKTGLIDGSLAGVGLFANQVLPFVKAKSTGNEFAATRIVRKHSPLLDKTALKDSGIPLEKIRSANEAASKLFQLWDDGKDPSLVQILQTVHQNQLFRIPDVLLPIAERSDQDGGLEEDAVDTEKDPIIEAWDAALECPFSRFEEYVRYISEESRFGTHQGIKGLEFPRVMVILDDEEAHGFLFSYEKLFGAKDPTDTDEKNAAEGRETSIDRSRRLFYVTCSRAEESLAIVAYTKDPSRVKAHVLSQGWFGEDEIVSIGGDDA